MPLPALLVIFCEVVRVVGSSTTAGQGPTTLAVSKRAPFITRFSTIWFSGDPSQIRTAEIGFDARVDIDRSLWGFCPTSVFVASDCGLAGNCVDRHACPRGCGKGGGLTTFTCTGSNGEFCTTAELYLSGGIGPYSYIGCGGGPTTDRYSAFTTDPTSASKTTSLSSVTATSATATTPATASQASESRGNSTALSTPTSAAGVESNTGSNTSNNTGTIIGGIIGCVALLCGSGIVVTWLLRRQRNGNNLAANPPSNPAPAYQYDANFDDRWQEPKMAVVKSELEGRDAHSSKPDGHGGAVELPSGWTPDVSS